MLSSEAAFIAAISSVRLALAVLTNEVPKVLICIGLALFVLIAIFIYFSLAHLAARVTVVPTRLFCSWVAPASPSPSGVQRNEQHLHLPLLSLAGHEVIDATTLFITQAAFNVLITRCALA